MSTPKRILIVEDENIVALDIKSTLINSGYEVSAIYAKGEEAVLNAAILKPDLILMDIMLSGKINGIEAAALIKEKCDIPVVYLTASTDSRTVESAKVTQPQAYLAKPFTKNSLTSTIEIALYKHDTDKQLRKSVEELKRRDRIQQTIVKILNSSADAASPDELFPMVHDAIKEVIPADNLYIALYDKRSKKLTFPYYIDNRYDKPADRTDANGLTEYLIGLNKPVLLNKDDVLGITAKNGITLLHAAPEVWLSVPIKVDEKYQGILVIKSYDNSGIIGEREKDLLEVISFSISRAVEKKMSEEEKKSYTEKLKELNKTKDKFFSLISHDLRSPFNSILGFTDILKNEYNELDEEEKLHMINSLYRITRKIYNMLDNLLQYSKFKTGNIKVEIYDYELRSLTERNIEVLKGSAIKKNITIINNIPETICVKADENLIDSVFQNLISNAVKFSSRGSEIIISAYKHDKDAVVEVRDQGIGLNPEQQKSLFKMEEMYSTAGTEGESGTGLGLLLTKEFLVKLGGNIGVRSEKGEGTAFIFTLPISNIKKNQKTPGVLF